MEELKEEQSNSISTLVDYSKGNLPSGLGIGSSNFDSHIVYKPNRFICVLGRPNIGKTFSMLWYFLCLSKKHGLKWAVYSTENDEWVLKMYLVEFLAAKNVKNLTEKEIYGYDNWIEEHFKFIPIGDYTMDDVLKLAGKEKVDGIFVDPYGSLEMPENVNAHFYDKYAIRKIQSFKKSNCSVYINHHPFTEAQRKVIRDKDDEYVGYPDVMRYYDVEGGGKWFNYCDQWISLHRFTSHPTSYNLTRWILEKEKVTQTGGKVTPEGQYILAEYSNNRFFINNFDPLSDKDELDFKDAEEFIF